MNKFKGELFNILSKPESVFLILGLIFGIVFMFFIPQFAVPDEAEHYRRILEIGNGCFYNKFSNYSVGGYSPVMYFFSVIGAKFGLLFNSELFAFYVARISNFLGWLLLIYSAIRITPVFKWHFVLFALLPMSLFEGVSVSADAFVNAFSFCFFAYMFYLIFCVDGKLSKKQIVIYILFSIISSQLKGCLIYPAFLMFLIKDNRKYYIGLLTIMLSIFAGGLWTYFNHIECGAGVDVIQNKLYLLSTPLDVLVTIAKTVCLSSYYWIKGLIGILGNTDVRFPEYVYLISILAYLSMFWKLSSECKITKKCRFLALGLIIMFFAVMLVALFLSWTPLGFGKIRGFQGRYIVFMLPLFSMFLTKNSKSNGSYIPYVLFLVILLTYSTYFLAKFY